MVKRENVFTETMKVLYEDKAKLVAKEEAKVQQKINEHEDFVNNYYTIIDARHNRERERGRIMEGAINHAYSKALKAIYITALEAETLTDNGLILAEAMADNYIKERGGASAIIRETRNSTYLLSELSRIVEDAAEDDVKDIDDLNKEEDSAKKEDKESDSDKEDKEEDSKKEEKKEDSDKSSEDDKDEKKEDSDKDDKKEESESDDDKKAETTEPKEAKEDDEVVDDDLEDIETDEDEDEEDSEEAPTGDKLIDDLEKEPDIKKAIKIIRDRISTAEKEFIKKNEEDKKEIDELLGRISDKVKTVNDMNDEDSEESKIAQESAIMDKRKINNIIENRPTTILEMMTRNLSKSIVKDNSIRDKYVTESGSLDTASVYESAKVMYGFLETVNTLQLEKVDKNYIENILNNM
jgi:hypothetical protein